jgi:hypothetical protein
VIGNLARSAGLTRHLEGVFVATLPTTPEELENLAKTGGIALTGALATGVFQFARAGIARLFARLGSDRQTNIEAQLDEDHELVTQAETTDRDAVRNDLAPAWGRRLGKLLKDLPDAAQDLQDVVKQTLTDLPEAQRQWVQNNIAAAPGSSVYGAMFGNVNHYDLVGKQIPPAPGARGSDAKQPR